MSSDRIVYSDFKSFVKKPKTSNSEISAPFHQYSRLPLELQSRIIQLCDPSTLFQLMHTCFSIRSEAEKIFWSREDVWYRIDEFQLQKEGKPVSNLRSCPAAARRVRQAVIECNASTCWIVAGGTRQYDIGSDVELARTFWDTFQKCFPLANRVVLNQSMCQPLPALPEALELKRVCDGLLALTSTCSPSVTSSFYLAYRPRRDNRYLTLVKLDENGTSTFVEQAWTAQRVNLPPVTGYLGAFRSHQMHLQLLNLEMTGTRPRGSRPPTYFGEVVPPPDRIFLQQHEDKFKLLENEVRASF